MSLYKIIELSIRKGSITALLLMVLITSACSEKNESGDGTDGSGQHSLAEAVQNPGPENRQVRSPIIPLQLENEDYPSAILVFSYQMENKNRHDYLRYFSTESNSFLWELELPASNLALQRNIATYNQDSIYLVHDKLLLAIERLSGSILWLADLSSYASFDCQECIQQADDSVYVLSHDLNLQAFSSNGESLWQQQLHHTYKNDAAIFILDEGIAVMDKTDRDDMNSPIALKILDPEDGNPVHTIVPSCPDPGNFYPDAYTDVISPLKINPSEKRVYFIFNGIRWSCLQSWNTGTAESIWQVERIEKFNLPLFEPAQSTLLGDKYLFIGTENSKNNAASIYSIRKSDGEPDELLSDADASLFIPVLVDDGLLISRVNYEYTLKSSKLAAYDTSGGDIIWEFPLVVKPSSLKDTSADIFVTHEGLAVVQFLDYPMMIYYDLLNPENGQVMRQVHSEMKHGHSEDSHPILSEGWVYFLHSDGMYALDLENEEVISLLGEF